MYGFIPIKHRSDCTHVYYKAAGTGILGVGDRVIRKAASTDPLGHAEVEKAAANGAMTGVIVGIKPFHNGDVTNQVNYIAAADDGYLLVDDDPNSLFKCIEGGAGTALTVATALNKHIDAVTNSDFNTTAMRSTSGIDNNALATGNAFIIVELSQQVGNLVGNTEVEWTVKPVLHTEVNASAANVTET